MQNCSNEKLLLWGSPFTHVRTTFLSGGSYLLCLSFLDLSLGKTCTPNPDLAELHRGPALRDGMGTLIHCSREYKLVKPL